MSRRQTKGVETRIVQISLIANVPRLFLRRKRIVDWTVRCTTQPAPACGNRPRVRQFPARQNIEDMPRVPRRGLILPCQIGKLAAEEGISGRAGDALRKIEAHHGFCSISTPQARGSDCFIAQCCKFCSLTGQTHPFQKGNGIVFVVFVKGFDHQRQPVGGTMSYTYHPVIGHDILQRISIGITSCGVFIT